MGRFDAQRPALVRAVRTRGNRRAYSRQDCGPSKRKGMWIGRAWSRSATRLREPPTGSGLNPKAATVQTYLPAITASWAAWRRSRRTLTETVLRSKLRIASKRVPPPGRSPFHVALFYTLLRNPIPRRRDPDTRARAIPAGHHPIVERSVWDKTQELLRPPYRFGPMASRAKPRLVRSSASCSTTRASGWTPSHAVKGNRRYRYYVSRSLMKGAARKSGQGWRVPALEIETQPGPPPSPRILDERTAIVADVDKARLGAHDITRSLRPPAAWSTRLQIGG